MSEIINLSRRDFLKTGAWVGGGLILGFSLPLRRSFSEAAEQPGAPVAPNAFIRIGTDDTVTIIANHSEMGQGVYTSLPMLVAEELECDWKRVRVEPAPVDSVYNHTVMGMQMTGGSTSVWSEYDRLRSVGATAREMLIAAAVRTWKADQASCHAEKGKVIHTSGKNLTYGQLAERAAALPIPKDVKLKDPSAFKIIGKPTRRLDTPEKTTGQAVFGIDVKVPGMLTALIARPPVFGGKVKSFNGDKARSVPGIKEIVQVESGVAVVAENFWPAKKAREALEIVWDEGALAKLSTAEIRKEYVNLAKTPGLTARKEGDPTDSSRVWGSLPRPCHDGALELCR